MTVSEWLAQIETARAQLPWPKGQRIVYFSVRFLAEICIHAGVIAARCTSGLPADARIVRAFHVPMSGIVGEELTLAVVFESAEWEALPQGAAIPAFVPAFEKIQLPETERE